MGNKPWLTFDCYDTLVRYTESKSAALEELIRQKNGDEKKIQRAKTVFEKTERELQLGPFIVLNEVIQTSLETALKAVTLGVSHEDVTKIISSVKSADPFPEVFDVLRDLKDDYRLAILSNSEPDIIRYNVHKIGIEFDAIVLASEAKCYKPSQGMFKELLRRINEPSINVTHIAQSFYHDMRTAKELGFGKRIWINRYNRKGDPEYKPDAELSDLTNVRGVITM
jgi:2-haloacid dehalogenase